MNVPLLIIAGTSLLFVLALVIFIVTVVRTIRVSRQRGWEDSFPSGAFDSGAGPLDTSLEGLEVAVGADAPSAALLTPLRTGEWVPPAEPAPMENLQAASLADRIADFSPAPDIAEPAFAIPSYPAWEIGEGTAAPVVTDGEVAAPQQEGTGPVESDDELDAEIAALLPVAEVDPPAIVEVPEVTPELPVVPVWVPPAVSEPEPAPVPEPEPEPAPALEPAPMPKPEPAPMPELAPEPPVPAAPRPEVHVSLPAPELSVEPAPPAKTVPAVPRPRVHVHVAQDSPERQVRPQVSGVTLVMNPELTERASVDPRMVMAAPVEMWFGDARVGVKAGTATYDRFRKYADALLHELKDSRGSSV